MTDAPRWMEAMETAWRKWWGTESANRSFLSARDGFEAGYKAGRRKQQDLISQPAGVVFSREELRGLEYILTDYLADIEHYEDMGESMAETGEGIRAKIKTALAGVDATDG